MNRLKQLNTESLFNTALKQIINILILYIIVILAAGLVKTLCSITALFSGEIAAFNLSAIVTDILTFLVMIELFRSFIEYFKAKRLRLHSMIDPAMIFVVRELIVKLYTHETVMSETLTGFGTLLLCMGVIRTLAVCFSPRDEGMPQ